MTTRRDFEPDPVALARLEAFVRRVLPGAVGSIGRIKTCLYTLTPDRDFVIDALPDHPTSWSLLVLRIRSSSRH